jgi:hypothetical protein
MYNRTILAAAIALAAYCCSVPELRAQQNDSASAFDKCRAVTPEDVTDKRAPSFAAYRVTSPETVENPSLNLKSNPIAPTYRTVLRQETAQGPNFAGHYRVAVWGCGSSCSMFAVVNLDTGRVITPEGFSHTSGVHFGVDTQKLFPESQMDYSLLGFTKDSRLLVVLGDLDEDESREGAFYFVLDHERLRLIHSTSVTRDCENLRDNPASSATEMWFSQLIAWKYGKEGLAWKTTIKSPNGQSEYQLALQPLWALEGGVVALEIVVARPGQPDLNILGKREKGVEYPFVITVEELESGLEHSKFGAVRNLEADGIALNVKIEHFRLGKGVGSGSIYCSKCKNLQELSVRITVESKGK